MAVVDGAGAAALLRGPADCRVATMRRVLGALARDVMVEEMREGVAGRDVLGLLEDLLTTTTPSTDPGRAGGLVSRAVEALAVRAGGPPRPRARHRRTAPTPLPAEDAVRLTHLLRHVTTALQRVLPRAVEQPDDDLKRLRELSAEQPAPEHTVAYLRRYATTVLDILDRLGGTR